MYIVVYMYIHVLCNVIVYFLNTWLLYNYVVPEHATAYSKVSAQLGPHQYSV